MAARASETKAVAEKSGKNARRFMMECVPLREAVVNLSLPKAAGRQDFLRRETENYLNIVSSAIDTTTGSLYSENIPTRITISCAAPNAKTRMTR